MGSKSGIGLVLKVAGGVAALLVVALLAAVTVYWWAPIGINAYANKVSIELALDSPELLTRLGLGDNTIIDFHSDKLDDHSEAGDQKALRKARAARAGLDRYGPVGLAGQEALTWDVLAHVLDQIVLEGESRIPPDPYRISQISGVAIDLPAFFTDQHQVVNRTSARRYVKRLHAFGRVLRDVQARVEQDRAAGISPPDFIIDKALVAMRAFITGGAEHNLLVTSFRKKLDDKLASWSSQDRDRLAAEALDAVETDVIPGYQSLITLYEDMRKTAPHDAGVWRLPGGADYYAARLRIQTTTDLAADEVHQIGLAEVGRIEAEMSKILDGRGLPKGEVGQRIDALMKDPAQLFPNTDAGREEMLAYLRQLQAGFAGKAKAWFLNPPSQPLEIVAVPTYAQDSAAGGYYNPPALDGTRPGRFYINLRNTADYPIWSLPTLFYHEAEPGHHFQLSAAQNVKGVPIIRQVVVTGAFAEGWGLYAEKLASEMGMYEGDDLGNLGRLQSEMFRAVRLVVDTGMHARKWSREEAIAYMRARTGMTEDEVTREIERYAAWPGQACSYKIGELTILRLREKARSALGSRFDIRNFHEAVLMNGSLPLDVLEQAIDAWIVTTKAAQAESAE